MQSNYACLLYVLVMAPKMTHVSGIKCGNTDLTLIARVIHLRIVPDRTNPADDGSIHMLLIDEKVSLFMSIAFLFLFFILNLIM